MDELQTMTPKHPRWNEFIDRLGGPEGCDFRDTPASSGTAEFVWSCAGGRDQSMARAILETMDGIDVDASLAYFSAHGGHCDCEIIFNVDPLTISDEDAADILAGRTERFEEDGR